ncbi:MAG: bifunctional demethylmenaquinone methyltransferase/2-methoxy-6-polyprenyl-1,4-benzoquinol methylase UbiE [Deltaproteobacteria bacterium]
MDNKAEKVKPYNQEDTKKAQVEKMFDNISHKYDFLNHLLSMGIDIKWRKNLISMLADKNPSSILDMATGTADLAIMTAKYIKDARITGLDLSSCMLEIGRQKLLDKNLADRIELVHGDSENMPFMDGTFDAITAAFGVRNYENLLAGLTEAFRVLKPGGSIFILEFSKPKNSVFRFFYNLYFKFVLPLIGKITSRDPKAYKYLFESVQAFPAYDEFTAIMDKAGFKSNNYIIQSFGICSIYHGVKL